VKGPAHRELRRFSVTEDFEPGGKRVYFPELDFNIRAAIEEAWVRLDGADNANFDPLNTRFPLMKCYKLLGAGGWENVRRHCCYMRRHCTYVSTVCFDLSMWRQQTHPQSTQEAFDGLPPIKSPRS
jgi:hypothetical protein